MFGIKEVQAHCDIPCKIYDPATAQIAVLSVIRLLDLISELGDAATSTTDSAQLARLTDQKESHAASVKHDIATIWGDYFKAPHRALPTSTSRNSASLSECLTCFRSKGVVCFLL